MHLKQFLSNSYLNFGDKLPSRSTTFIFVKWLLFSFVCFILVASVILVPFASRLIQDLEPHATEQQMNAYKTELLLGLVIIVIFFSIGAYGIFKEHFCMATAFAIFMVSISWTTDEIHIKTIPTDLIVSFSGWYHQVFLLIGKCLVIGFAW